MYKYLILLAILFSCGKHDELKVQENMHINLYAKSSYPQNPMPPQISVKYPVPVYVTSPCPGYIWQQVCCDTLNLSFSASAGRKWTGSPDKLSKYRIVVDNVIVEEKSISGQSFSYTYICKLPVKSLNVFDTTIQKWHSIGVSVWQTDGNIASNGQYIFK
jgi:hypothetical protein